MKTLQPNPGTRSSRDRPSISALARLLGAAAVLLASAAFAQDTGGGTGGDTGDGTGGEGPAAPTGAAWPIDDGVPLRDLAARHGVGIGNAIRYEWRTIERFDPDVYERIIAREFDVITPESSMKWEFLHPLRDRYDFADTDRAVDFAEANSQDVHGHPLLWYRLNPMWLETLPADEVEAAMVGHIDTVMRRYRGRIGIYDVVNEALADAGEAAVDGYRASPFFDAIGPGYVAAAFRAARAADPEAELIYNDYGIGWPNPKSDAMFELVDGLLADDVPIDGVGLQLHLDHTFLDVEGISTVMQKLADRGLDVHVTEFDVGVLSPDDYAAQAELYEEVMRRCLMQPACRAFQIWGLDDFHSFRPFFDPLPFDDDLRPKPAFYAMRSALATEPVHPEACVLDGLEVSGGDVRANAAGSATGGSSSALCAGVRLGPGFGGVAVRYRNAGADVPTLVVRTDAGETLAEIPLEGTASNVGGRYTTSRVDTLAMPTGTRSLVLALEGDAGGVELDGLLFDEPAGPLTPEGDTAGGGGGGGSIGAGMLVLLSLALAAGGIRCRVGRRRASRRRRAD